jgi:hypothetical protein
LITPDQQNAVKQIEVTGADVGFAPGQSIQMWQNNTLIATGTPKLTAIGSKPGYFHAEADLPSDNDCLFDGDYYQEFSFEINTSVSPDKYHGRNASILDVAGSKRFSKVNLSYAIQTSQSSSSQVQEVNE